MQERQDTILMRMRERGCRVTPQRVAILNALLNRYDHPSVEQIFEQVKRTYPMISLATVYKTVAVLKEMGEILELGFPEGGNRYDGSGSASHPHLICLDCGAILDVEEAGANNLSAAVAQQTGYQIVNYQFDLYGVCPACRNKIAQTI